MWEMIRYKMLSLSDATGHRTALTAFHNCIYLLPLGFLAHQSACQRNYFGSIPISFKQAILCWEFSRSKVSFLFLSGLLQETMAVLTKCGLLGFMCSGYHHRISFTKLHKQQIHLSLPRIWTNMTYISYFQKQFILSGRVKQSGAQVRFKHIYVKDCSWKNGQD
jgi:hypothetical protein